MMSVAPPVRGTASQPCDSQAKLEPDERIVVVRKTGSDRRTKGRLASSDENGIRIETPTHTGTIAIPWNSVQKIRFQRRCNGLWTGLFIGSALAGASILGADGPGGNLAVAFLGVGAGAGALAGALGDRPRWACNDEVLAD